MFLPEYDVVNARAANVNWIINTCQKYVGTHPYN
jgi:hypothetical protein